jgi:hypothetical protein
MLRKHTTILGAGLVAALAACAPAKAPEPIYAEPVFNKYGDPSCRPPTVPVGGIYAADLPLCPLIAGVAARPVATAASGVYGAPGTVASPPGTVPVDPIDPATGEPNRNTNRNRNQNQNGA